MRANKQFVACLAHLLADLVEAESDRLDSMWINDVGGLTEHCQERYALYHRLLKAAAGSAGLMVKAGGAVASGPETPEDLHTIAEGLRAWGDSLRGLPAA